jgi:secreted trypsin-like serine protease
MTVAYGSNCGGMPGARRVFSGWNGYSVAIADADLQGSAYQWRAALGLRPQGVDLVRAPDATALVAAIKRLHGFDVVVIDAPAITATSSFHRRCALLRAA